MAAVLTVVPQFFDHVPMQRVDSAALDRVLADAQIPLTILFLWGHHCPNCDVAKQQIVQAQARFRWPQVRWLHDNVYEDRDMATRFGLHGIPTFLVFRGARKLGRISPWPGADPFCDAIERQIAGLPSA